MSVIVTIVILMQLMLMLLIFSTADDWTDVSDTQSELDWDDDNHGIAAVADCIIHHSFNN